MDKSTIVFTFGRFVVPTIGHERLFKRMLTLSKNLDCDMNVFVSHTYDKENNIFTYQEKLSRIKKAFPWLGEYITKTELKSAFEIVHSLIRDGYTTLNMVVGGDRIKGFQKAFDDFVKSNNNPKNVEIKIFNGGNRSDASIGIDGISTTKTIGYALKGAFDQFRNCIPLSLNDVGIRELYDSIRKRIKPKSFGKW